MNKTSAVILIESGNLGDEIPSIVNMGYEVIYITTGLIPFENNHRELLAEYIKDRNIISSEVINSYINKLISKYNIISIFTSSDFFVHSVSIICEKYNMQFLNPETAYILTNKHELRRKQSEYGYNTPEFHVLYTLDEGKEIIINKKKNWVFKPVNGNESVGVKLISTKEELERCYFDLVKISRYTKNLINGACYLLEEYVEGNLYSCEFLKDIEKEVILGVTNRLVSNPPNFIELGYSFPFEDERRTQKIIDLTKKFIKDFNFDYGPCHIEYIITPSDDIYICEVGPRLIGPPNPWMINRSLNCNIFDIVVNLYIRGYLEEIATIPVVYTTCLEIVSPINGKLIKFCIDLNWLNRDDVHIIRKVTDGDYLKKAESNTNIIARILTVGEKMIDSQQLAFEILMSAKLQLEVDVKLDTEITKEWKFHQH